MTSPFLTTGRIELWQPTIGDEPAMSAIVAEPRTKRFLGPEGSRADSFTRFHRNAGSWFLHGYGAFMLRLKGRPEVVGNCGVFHTWRGLGEDFDDRPEAGWILGSDHVGKGLAGEAMAAVLEWFDDVHGPREIVCMISTENGPSVGLAHKLGFVETRRAEMPGTSEQVRLFSRAAA